MPEYVAYWFTEKMKKIVENYDAYIKINIF